MIYIQSNSSKMRPHHFDAACALFGAIDSELDYRLITYEEIMSTKFNAIIRRNLFVGSTDFMQGLFSLVGLTDVRLPKNSNRPSEIITLEEALTRAKAGEKLFIKPLEIKLFTGFVLDQMQYACLENKPLDTPLLAYKPFEERIESEWRVYVHHHKMLDSKNYSGDFTLCPNYEYVDAVIKENSKIFPCAYTIDIGVLTSNENVVIEYNDMWAIGNYGIPNDLYLKALRDRYAEIMKNV